MSTEGRRNVLLGLVLLPLGLLGGLALSLFSFVPLIAPPPGFQSYVDLPRRLMRLAHIAAVMLPLINIVVGRELDALSLSVRLKRAVSWLLLGGAVGLPLALALEALVPPLAAIHPSGLPAFALTAALIIVGVGALRTLRAAQAQPVVSRPRDFAASSAFALSAPVSFTNQVFRSSRSL